MKKKDFIKLALLGIAMGLCTESVEANGTQSGQGTPDEEIFTASCGKNTCSANPSAPPSNYRPESQQQPQQSPNSYRPKQDNQTADTSGEAQGGCGASPSVPQGSQYPKNVNPQGSTFPKSPSVTIG